MALTPMKDCATQVEALKLLYANDYMRFVSSGMKGLGASQVQVNWPPGPRPEPYSWKDRNGTEWKLVLLDQKWIYRDGKRNRYITPSELYELMGMPKTTDGALPLGIEIPGKANPNPPGNWDWLSLGGLGAGWAIVIGVGGYQIYKAFKRKKAGRG